MQGGIGNKKHETKEMENCLLVENMKNIVISITISQLFY